MSANPSSPQYPIASVDNALKLLLYFKDAEGLRLSDAARVLGVANSTAHRLLAMLQHHGFVEQDADSKVYAAGPALMDIGLRAASRIQFRDVARPMMSRLVATFEETVHLAILEGTTVRYIDAVESPRALRVAVRTGHSEAAHCTSTGKALLAELDPAELRSRYAGVRLTAATDHSITTMAALTKELDRVRARGYASNVGESEADMTSVAVTIHNAAGEALAAISVAAPSDRLLPERFDEVAEVMRAEAATVSSKIGR